MARLSQKSQFPTITTAGGLLPADFLLTLKTGIERQGASDLPGLQASDYHLGGETFGEATNRAWNALQGRWEHFKAYLDEKDDTDTTHAETWDRFLRPLFRELGYGQLERNLSVEIEADTYKITHHWRKIPVHLLGAGISIDKRTPGAEGAARKSPHAMVQEFLNRSDDHLWAFVSNGLRLRILRDNVSLTRQAYVEFDLFAMFEGGEYADFQLLWLLCHQSRVEGTPPETCWLERWATEAKQRGVRMLDGLRDGVEKSISALGEGFLKHPNNRALRERLTSGELSTQDYYRQVLRIVYRLIFLFVAEDRNLLLDPDGSEKAKSRYREHYATDRLRELAQRRRGSVHPDLWEQLKLIMRALGSPEGQPALALPALGSFLWNAERSTPDLADVTLSNTYLLEAIRALATIRAEKEKVRRVVDYRNLGAEELGSVYESLLELHPQINLDARTFALDSSAGNDRKTSGSYYTPDSLVQCLLDTALEPVIKDRLAEARKASHAKGAEAKAAAQEQALLDLKVCDPAVGSGHFLIAAGHRIARHLARIRSGEEEPSPADYQDALRDVVGRCLYGVDMNPMAVELCKVSLWIEAMEPGKPLSFLDHHIRCGNALLGTTPALIAKGIPDGAYKVLTGDDAKACSFLKSRNKGEREGIGGLFIAEDTANLDVLRNAAESVESIADDSITDLQRKEQEYEKAESSCQRLKQKRIADLWCAAFVWEKNVLEENAEEKCTKATGITTRHLQSLAKDGALSGEKLDQLHRFADEYQFFHWHVEFPGVFSRDNTRPDNEDSAFSSGFDCVLGNPPWDRVKPEPSKYFAASNPEIASAKTAAVRDKLIAQLEVTDPFLFRQWQRYERKMLQTALILTESGAYPLTGQGKYNLGNIFVEFSYRMITSGGRAGMLNVSGLATDDAGKEFIAHVMKNFSLVSFYDFENREGLFNGVDSRYKFSAITLRTKQDQPSPADFVFFAHSIDDLSSPERHVQFKAVDIGLLNPISQNCPVFREGKQAELVKFIYRLADLKAPPEKTLFRRDATPSFMFVMSDHSNLFVDGERRVSLYHDDDSHSALRLYESKMFHQFEHRWATFVGDDVNNVTNIERSRPEFFVSPRHWMMTDDASPKLNKIGSKWMLAVREVTNSTNERTSIAAILPTTPLGHNAQFFLFNETPSEATSFVANLNSIPFDFVARTKIGGSHLSSFILRQLPLLPAETFDASVSHREQTPLGDHLVASVVELTYTAWDLEPFALDCGYDGPPFRWNEERRFQIRCELDALFFHLYLPCDDAGDWRKPARIADGAVRDETEEELATLKSHFPTPRDAVAYIMETFPIVKRKDIARTEQKDAEGNVIKEGAYLTKDRILQIYDEMLEARRERREWKSPLDPPPGPPTDSAGNIIPFEQWKDDLPSHIHGPRSTIETKCTQWDPELDRFRTDFRKSVNEIFRLPDQQDRPSLSKGRGEDAFYAKFTSASILPADEENPERSLWVLEAFSKSWFDENPPPNAGRSWRNADEVATYYESARIFALELELAPAQIERFEALQNLSDGIEAAQDADSWFVVRAGEPRDGRSADQVVPLNVFTSIYQAAAEATLQGFVPAPSGTQAQLNSATGSEHIPDASDEDLDDAFSQLSASSIDWIVAYDVGQGTSIGFGEKGKGVGCYVDMGGGTRQNSATFPSALQQFCFSEDPPIILSHWHDDHYSSANRDPAAFQRTWIAPRQKLGSLGAKLMAQIVQAGGRLLFLPAAFVGRWFGPIHLELCNGSGKNNSGIAVTLSERGNGRGEKILFPGDAEYQFIPSFSGGASYLSVVAPHHGGVMKTTQPFPICPQQSFSRLVYSAGPKNSYKHPKPATRQAHDNADWRDPNYRNSPPYETRLTENRGPSGFGHVILGWQSAPRRVPVLACGGVHCQLRAEQSQL